MKNTLKIVLLLLGGMLIGYGLYTLLEPEVTVGTGPMQVEGEVDNTQSLAMIGLGLLTLLGGLAFNKR